MHDGTVIAWTFFKADDFLSAMPKATTAVEKARSQQLDIILMDMFMPKMVGCTACFELKKYEITKSIPIVTMTGKGREAH